MAEARAEPAVRISGLGKAFRGHLGIGRNVAVDGVDLEVRQGDVFGLLGRNGGYVMFHTIEGLGRVEIAATRFHREEPGVDGTGDMPTVSMKTTSSRRWTKAFGSSMTLPPSLITVILSRNWRIHVRASSSTSAFWMASCK